MAFIWELCTKSLHIGQFRSGLIHWCRLPGGGGDSAYERDGDARRKFGIKVSVNENFSTLLDFDFFFIFGMSGS